MPLTREQIERLRELIVGGEPEAIATQDADALCDMALRYAYLRNDAPYHVWEQCSVLHFAQVDAAIDAAMKAPDA